MSSSRVGPASNSEHLFEGIHCGVLFTYSELETSNTIRIYLFTTCNSTITPWLSFKCIGLHTETTMKRPHFGFRPKLHTRMTNGMHSSKAFIWMATFGWDVNASDFCRESKCSRAHRKNIAQNSQSAEQHFSCVMKSQHFAQPYTTHSKFSYWYLPWDCPAALASRRNLGSLWWTWYMSGSNWGLCLQTKTSWRRLLWHSGW